MPTKTKTKTKTNKALNLYQLKQHKEQHMDAILAAIKIVITIDWD
ncbi:hypothetical protein RCF98_04710 [Thiothrix lacustris]|uniref:Uncharacterized protein n=1 Tax=Thiothrix lacustris TaxID=525917 RepID=A0ABY9MSM4_9GAMM|nr:hypothetical protein [Thiothrix lacustris]WML91643.1 hypothetical protein RCF98_04710 [Thiothrix lacustris]